MRNVYLYDGSFPSLLYLVVTLLHSSLTPADIKSYEEYQASLFDNAISIKLIEDEIIYKSYLNKLSSKVMHIVYYVYLSSSERKELVIYYFIKNALKYKDEIIYRRNLNCVNEALKLSKYVGSENHKFKGFLRFKELDNGLYYAEVTPNNNIISLLAMHFKDRLRNESFLIKDKKRNIYALKDESKIYYLNDKDIEKLNINLSDNEKDIEQLWKTFFKTIAIKERKNKKAQMNFMPKRYWKDMIEMEEEYENGNKR